MNGLTNKRAGAFSDHHLLSGHFSYGLVVSEDWRGFLTGWSFTKRAVR